MKMKITYFEDFEYWRSMQKVAPYTRQEILERWGATSLMWQETILDPENMEIENEGARHVNMWTCGTWLSWLSWNRKYEDWKWRRQACEQNVEEDQEPLDIWCPLITVIKCFKGHREIHLEWLELWSEKSPYHWIRMSWEELMMWRTRNYGGSQMGNIWKASKKQTKCVFGVLPLSKWRWV